MTLGWKRGSREPGTAAQPPRAKSDMKILVVSDVESKFLWEHFDPEQFRGVQLMISCGDLKAIQFRNICSSWFCLFSVPNQIIHSSGNSRKNRMSVSLDFPPHTVWNFFMPFFR